MMEFNIIKYFLATLNNRNLFLSVGVVFIIFYLAASNYYSLQGRSYLEGLKQLFIGPQLLNMELWIWLLHQVPIIVICGNLWNKHLNPNMFIFFSRAGSILTWLRSILCAQALIITLYYFAGFIITSGVMVLFSNNYLRNISNWLVMDMFFQLLLLIISTYCTIIALNFITVLTSNSIISFCSYLIFICLSIGLYPMTKGIYKWLPFGQGVFINREQLDLSISWSLSYLIILSTVLVIGLYCLLKRCVEHILSNEIEGEKL